MRLRLNLQFFAQEKTEKATPKKKQETRNKGQVPKSTDVNTAFILLAVFLFMFLYGGVLGTHLFTMMQHVYQEYIQWDITTNTIPAIFKELSINSALVMMPIMLVALFVGMGASMLQVGFMFTPEAIKFKLEKINPLSGFKRIFSLRALVEFLKSMLKILLVGMLVFTIIWLSLDSLMFLSQKSVSDGFGEIARLTGIIGVSAALLLLFLSIPDYIYQKYDHEKQIRMSKQDVKDEQKKMEGDPLIKSKRRKKQMDMAMQRMMQEVPKADVVITNPTHFAIALTYEEDKMAAPKITAKGADFVALRIKTIAKNNDVILVENKPLARALYNQTDIGDEVPEELFKAVAEVLAYVYRLKNQLI
ncbi:flagellar biosynthesis protein FlhB [Alteribacillus sp. YIM 98480]|uniref:flagellar biosynthesis protein FlhB n=1 Tax=Alteribacillus sp. YIM 98480 TaxID=2606599 RepID=UPI00131ADF5E|nr:flagellar biosynthesis protein FlhB [Alteribacillus sp. YIM 98480]